MKYAGQARAGEDSRWRLELWLAARTRKSLAAKLKTGNSDCW